MDGESSVGATAPRTNRNASILPIPREASGNDHVQRARGSVQHVGVSRLVHHASNSVASTNARMLPYAGSSLARVFRHDPLP
ncbi:hypothetical protein TRAPUB_5149 [Trametes pubescens]|uniref:Uncharacterized protein n=1 Tax=Trametes pubescens TaxID=154538 RepID=A0A1M2V9I4_TRAPU|nr:hypothetical protein TRAPUB_5149 [Trametes pubescens]